DNHDLPREQMLHPYIPLIYLRIAGFRGVQAVVVRQAPQGQRPKGSPLRFRQSGRGRKWIIQRRELALEIVLGEANRAAVSKCRSWELKIRSHTQAVVSAGA